MFQLIEIFTGVTDFFEFKLQLAPKIGVCELTLRRSIPTHHSLVCSISLITGWTVYTEKYKARGPDV